MPRDGILSDSYASDRCCFPNLDWFMATNSINTPPEKSSKFKVVSWSFLVQNFCRFFFLALPVFVSPVMVQRSETGKTWNVFSCPWDLRLSLSYWSNLGATWNPSNITALSYWGVQEGLLILPPLCRETPVSQTGDVFFPRLESAERTEMIKLAPCRHTVALCLQTLEYPAIFLCHFVSRSYLVSIVVSFCFR